MPLALLTNLSSFLTQRTKINDAITEINHIALKSFDYTSGAPYDTGNVSSQGSDSITDNTKSWVVNEHVGRVAKMLTANLEEDYGIVVSNTATTLTFDENHAGYTFATYSIVSTFEIEDVNSITGFEIPTYDAAIVLPSLATVQDRDRIDIYISESSNVNNVAVVCRAPDRQIGQKWGSLIYNNERVSLISHLEGTNHWDIFDLFGVKRYASVRTTLAAPITTTSYSLFVPFTSMANNLSNRFELVNRSTFGWYKYRSIVTNDFSISGALVITRTGGGTSNVEITVRVKKFVGGSIVDSTVSGIAKFSGDDTKTIPLEIPVRLDPYDEVTIIAKRDAGTIELGIGSSLIIKEM